MKGYVILIAAVAALGGLLFGFDTAVIAGTLKYLTHYFALSNSALGLIVAAASIGCILGALVAGRLADRYGRKIMLIVTSLLYIVAALGSGVASDFTELLIYRLVGGVAIGMASALAPVYISEIAASGARGRLGMLQQLAIVTGILVSFISNYLIVNSKLSFLNDDNYWRYMLAAAVIPSLVFFILLLLVPESPRWLVTQGKLGPAERIFEKIYGSPATGTPSDAASDLAQAQVQAIRVDLQAGPAAPLREVLSPRYRRTVLIGLVFAAVAQLTGINIVFYYAPLIFEKTRMGGSVLYQTLLTGIVNLVFTIVAFWLIDRLGRKKLLLMGSWVMGLCTCWSLGVLFLEGRLGNYLVLGCWYFLSISAGLHAHGVRSYGSM